MKRAISAAAIAGITASAHAQTTGIQVTASQSVVQVGDSVTWTVTITNQGVAAGPFGNYLRWAYLDLINTTTSVGTVTSFDFTNGTGDLNALGTARALDSDATIAGADVNDVEWTINFLTGDGVGDYILGDVFESPYVLATFTLQASEAGTFTYDVAPDQSFIESTPGVNGGIAWGSGTLGLTDTSVEFQSWSVISDTVTFVGNPIPAPASALAMIPGLWLASRRRR